MILAYITDTFSITTKPVKTNQVNVKPEIIMQKKSVQAITERVDIEKNSIEKLKSSDNGNVSLNSASADTDSYEMKYKMLMQKIEKERFERELLADTR